MIIVMAGLPGTGKTTLARSLAERLSGIVLNKDEIRSALFPAADIEYSTEQDDFCMEIMLQTAAYLLRRNPERVVFLDGRPFAKRSQLDSVLQRTRGMHQKWCILECACSETTARKRLTTDADTHPAADRNFALYLKIRDSFEPITAPKTVVETDQPLELCVNHALQAVAAASA